ncbi:uncharacterized protein LOC127853942 [Dreissena polymorpha]|nr:uncharacterized protein LOC127853942 [Dreissena polymorpha]
MSCHDNFNGSDDSFEVPCSDWPKCQRQCRDDVHECTFMYQAIDVQSQNCGKAIPSLTGDCRCPSTASHNAVLCTSSFSHAPCCTAASLENSYAPSFKNSNFPSSANVDQADRSRLYPLNTNATDVNNTPPIIIYSRFQKENPAEVNGKRIEVVKSSKKRGRPCTYLKYLKCDQFECDAHDKRGASNILYQFLLKELRTQQTHIKWENEQEGKFKFVDTTECSRRWGQMKKIANMNFEKLSRAMRYYYRDGLMCKVKGLRLVYQINWEVVPKEYWPQAPQLFQRLLDCRVKKM